jgi:hypothetical protein
MSVAFMNSSREMGWAVEEVCAAVGRPTPMRTASRKAGARAIRMERKKSLAELEIYIQAQEKAGEESYAFYAGSR